MCILIALISFFIGVFITVFIIMFFYATRIGIFRYCPTSTPYCSAIDYYNNPGNALANGANINDILFLDSNNQLLYKRVLKTNECVPQSNQTIIIKYPEYCSFTRNGRQDTTYRLTTFGSNIYKPVNNAALPTIVTDGNCIPTAGQYFDDGTPLIEWDPTSLND